ncbi:MAG TPA: glycosyltransferase family 4 protein [Solirubrobacteraceae bacterium]|jgi:glycosyltransferase involved in cell wall biosynthesis|nr:glycosyltransferase family 4 protein [Solirubrobacteraceae bacterium]
MTARPLRIAWLGGAPARAESGGVPGVATELLFGLAELGHELDCYLPGTGREVPARLAEHERVRFIWGTSKWRWHGWYNKTRIGVAVTWLLANALSARGMRRALEHEHRARPYDLIYQFSSIEGLVVSARLTRAIPLVVHPETHAAGELRALIAERRLALRYQARYAYAIALVTMGVRTLVQRRRIRRARLLICISRVFRDHLVRDYDFPPERTAVIPNPVRLARFEELHRRVEEPPTVLVLGRVAARKGIEDVVQLAHGLHERGAPVRLRVVGGPGQWSDYTSLLGELPASAEYVGHLTAAQIPDELARTDVLLQASKYEPFGLTVAEALAAGVCIVATSEVGAIEDVDRTVVSEVAPGEVGAMAAAVQEMIERARARPEQLSAAARAEAARLFAPEVVCASISRALEQLMERSESAPGVPVAAD